MKKQLGYIGLGKMGYNMTERLSNKGYEIVAYDKNPDLLKNISTLQVQAAKSLAELASKLKDEKVIWIMVPHQVVDEVISELKPFLKIGDTIIDGGNSPYKESIRRGKDLKELGVNFLDVGVSGGPEGAKNGACLMIGGEEKIFEINKDLFVDISATNAYAYLGKNGSGHFTKMIHNGIEYGMMQSIAEGFGILKASEFHLPLEKVAKIYNNQSVIESRLVNWLKNAFEKYGENLEEISGVVEGTGEGKWTVETGQELGILTPAISAAVEFRNQSKQNPSFVGQVVSALRNQFGGHKVDK